MCGLWGWSISFPSVLYSQSVMQITLHEVLESISRPSRTHAIRASQVEARTDMVVGRLPLEGPLGPLATIHGRPHDRGRADRVVQNSMGALRCLEPSEILAWLVFRSTEISALPTLEVRNSHGANQQCPRFLILPAHQRPPERMESKARKETLRIKFLRQAPHRHHAKNVNAGLRIRLLGDVRKLKAGSMVKLGKVHMAWGGFDVTQARLTDTVGYICSYSKTGERGNRALCRVTSFGLLGQAQVVAYKSYM
jgi:hypothetical protein